MFYKLKVQDHIRVQPKLLGKPTKEAIVDEVKHKYGGFISKDLGIVIDVADVEDVDEGIMIAGDAAVYFPTTFNLISFKVDMHEVLPGRIKDIADFGAFISIGPIEGMIHISQTMNDFVSFSKDKALLGKESKRNLKIGDQCNARVIAISFKDVTDPKIGLTMRQAGLGKSEWIEEDLKKAKK